MRKAFDLTDKMIKDILERINTKTMKDISTELNIPYHVVMRLKLTMVTTQVDEHRLHSGQEEPLEVEYTPSPREMFKQVTEVEINGILYRVIRSDENEWLKND